MLKGTGFHILSNQIYPRIGDVVLKVLEDKRFRVKIISIPANAGYGIEKVCPYTACPYKTPIKTIFNPTVRVKGYVCNVNEYKLLGT